MVFLKLKDKGRRETYGRSQAGTRSAEIQTASKICRSHSDVTLNAGPARRFTEVPEVRPCWSAKVARIAAPERPPHPRCPC
jgi:hypothetical protein